MEQNIFHINNFNVISDDEFYYVFRALNNRESKEREDSTNKNESKIQRIRTSRERKKDENLETRYNENSELTLNEVYDHSRVTAPRKDTNCISLTSNANVCIDYGEAHYNDQYVMVKIPKTGDKDIIFAGEYIVKEIQRSIEQAMQRLEGESRVLEQIKYIDEQNDIDRIIERISETFKIAKSNQHQRFTGKNNKIFQKESLSARFRKKQIFSNEQQLEYSKLIGKLTMLEIYGKIGPIIENTRDNTEIIKTLGAAFSNLELLHYNSIDKDKFKEISRTMMDLISLVQQSKERLAGDSNIKEIEEKLIKLVNEGYDFVEKEGEIILTNGSNDINIGNIESSELSKNLDYDQPDVGINDMYEISNGSIPYDKMRKANQFAYNLSISKLKSGTISDILSKIMDKNEKFQDIFQDIDREGYVLNKNIIRRHNGKGIKISESVNLDANNEQGRNLTQKEQKNIVNEIKKMDKEQLKTILSSKGESIRNLLFNQLLDKEENKSENQYFTEAIVDNCKWSHTLNKEERKIIIEKVERMNVKRIYQALEKAGIQKTKIPECLINIVSQNVLRGFDYKELSEEENLEKLIYADRKYLEEKVDIISEDILLGKHIEDDFRIPGTDVILKFYQRKAFEKINEIYKKERFASVVLPTGAGKSFVAMAEILNKVQSKANNILYFAPNTTILHQQKNHIIKYVLKEDPQLYKTEKQKDKAIKDGLKKMGLNINLELKCYQSLTKNDEEELSHFNSDLIILDEMHRTGAEKWFKQIGNLIAQNKNAKILGITATPDRDVDGRNMSEELAQMVKIISNIQQSGKEVEINDVIKQIPSYTDEHISKQEYMAYSMELIEAMQNEVVVIPKIVTTILKPKLKTNIAKGDERNYEYEYEGQEEINDIKEKIENFKGDEKAILNQIYEDIQETIKNADGVPKILQDNLTKKNGKYIVFLPTASKGEDEIALSEFEEYKKMVKSWFDEAGIKLDESCMYQMSSHIKPNRINDENLSNFEADNSDSAKLMFVVGKLDEGVHVDGINGIIWLREIDEKSRIKYLQQLGRCIFSLNEDQSLKEEDIPVVFDLMNNTLRQNLDRDINSYTAKDDAEKLREIIEWIEYHNDYRPDINSTNKIEARKAITLKRIQEKYYKYLNKENLEGIPKFQIDEIIEILELGKEIDLWNIELPDKIDENGQVVTIDNASRINNFGITGEMKRYLDLIQSGKELDEKKIRISQEIKYLQLLERLIQFGFNISKIEKMSLDEVIKNLDNEKIIKIEDLKIDGKKRVGEFVKNLRNKYNATEEKELSELIFSGYSVQTLYKMGILRDEQEVDENFVTKGIHNGKHVITGTNENENGESYAQVNFKGLDTAIKLFKAGILNKDRSIYSYDKTVCYKSSNVKPVIPDVTVDEILMQYGYKENEKRESVCAELGIDRYEKIGNKLSFVIKEYRKIKTNQYRELFDLYSEKNMSWRK